MQPLAAKYGLKMVSPTFNYGNIEWSSGFLKACVDLADDPEHPCDYSLIAAMAIHDYKCSSKKVQKRYGAKTGEFFTNMQGALDGYGGIDWASWL